MLSSMTTSLPHSLPLLSLNLEDAAKKSSADTLSLPLTKDWETPVNSLGFDPCRAGPRPRCLSIVRGHPSVPSSQSCTAAHHPRDCFTPRYLQAALPSVRRHPCNTMGIALHQPDLSIDTVILVFSSERSTLRQSFLSRSLVIRASRGEPAAAAPRCEFLWYDKQLHSGADPITILIWMFNYVAIVLHNNSS